ncbi:MAG: YihY/virulence factor BrkB family protein [Cytophagales bacterium]|nr:MAG: YihY/virulence factor BrkB family protein [Cytophagales bacterium]
MNLYQQILAIWKIFLKKLKRTRLAGSSLYKILKIFLTEALWRKDLHQQASAIAFSFTLSIFPAIIVIFTLLPYFQTPQLGEKILLLLEEVMPYDLRIFVLNAIREVIAKPRGGLLSISVLFAVYTATSGVLEMMNAFNNNYQYAEKRSWLYKRILATILAIVFAFLLLLAVVFIMVGEFILNQLLHNHFIDALFSYYLVLALRYFSVFIIFWVTISAVYYIAPAVNNHWRFFSSGSFLAAILIIINTLGFSYYLAEYASYDRIYGSIGTVIALMIWLYLIAWILLLGFEVNVTLVTAQKEEIEEEEIYLYNQINENI